MTDDKALAYDPVEDRDVEIDCRQSHTSTRPRDIDGESLPVTIESDFRHDPVEGCQGTSTKIIESECPVCGFHLANSSYHTLAGVGRTICRACGVDHTEKDAPVFPEDRITRIKNDCDRLGQTGRDGIELYKRDFSRGKHFHIISDDRSVTVARSELVSLVAMTLDTYDEEEDPLPKHDGVYLLRKIAQAMEPTDDDEDEENND